MTLRPGERLDDLCYNGLKLIQHPDCFRFGCDAVELANFVSGGSRDYAVELGTGTGVIALLMAAKYGMRVTAVELQPQLADMAARSVALNGLEALVDVLCLPIQRLSERLEAGCASVVVSNPPYRKQSSGLVSADPRVALARHEIAVTLAETVDCAAYLLRSGGRFFLVHRAERLAEAMALCQSKRLAPKVLQLLTPTAGKAPHLFLLKCVAGGAVGLTVRPERPVDTRV